MADTFGDRDTTSVVQACPASQPETYWIEIEMIGEDGKPIPWIEYLVVLPNGKKVKGYLDNDGYARLDQLAAAGGCQISFPGLDKDAWSYVESVGARPASG